MKSSVRNCACTVVTMLLCFMDCGVRVAVFKEVQLVWSQGCYLQNGHLLQYVLQF